MQVTIDFKAPSGDAALQIVIDEGDTEDLVLRLRSELRSAVLPFVFMSDVCKLPWVDYLQVATHVRHVAMNLGIPIIYSEEAARRIRLWVSDCQVAAGNLDRLNAIDVDSIENNLRKTEWNFENRSLTPVQLRDLTKMNRLPNAANFSVPGAGKTTVALANHLLWSDSEQQPHLLIVAPKNAFPAWEEAIEICLKTEQPLTRLVGGIRQVKALLRLDPRFSIISYTQLVNAERDVKHFLLKNKVHVVVDESHRMKSGARGLAPSVLLRLSPYMTRRDVLSGTPAPQAPLDLEPQMRFMYPATSLSTRILNLGPKAAIGHLYARTTQRELGLKPAEQSWETSQMTDVQKMLYAAVADATIQQLLAPDPKIRLLRPAVMTLLQTAIDPIGASKSIIQSGRTNSKLLDICLEVIDEDKPQRLLDAVALASRIIDEGRKVVLWAPFTHTLKTLAELAAPFGAEIIYGGTSSGDEDEDGTRENIVKRFHLDDELRVLIANPAAGGEGISLHRASQDAIFVGRTYNQAHYLQARDRTNRLGMPIGTTARETIIELATPVGIGSIDLSVRRRLQIKIDNMADILNDSDLKQLVLDIDEQDQFLDDNTDIDDIRDLINQLQNGTASA
jgi:SNF2 family DNA or RNA helicase